MGVQLVVSSASANTNLSQAAADVFMKGVCNFAEAHFNQDTSVTHLGGPAALELKQKKREAALGYSSAAPGTFSQP